MAALILSAGSLILSGFTFVFFLTYLKRRTGRDRILAELSSDLREEAVEIEREINAVTDRDITLVEDRVKTLRALLDDADRRIAVYVRELERRQAQEETFAALDREPPVNTANAAAKSAPPGIAGTYSDLGKRRPAADPNSAAADHASAENPAYLNAGLFRSADPGRPQTTPEPAAPAETATAPPKAGHAKRIHRSGKPVEPKPLPFAERVAELYRAGFSSSLIASRLGSTITEVELAITLAERRNG
jgi:hypothetical protein